MAEVDTSIIFSHPSIGEKLVVLTGVNDIFWQYRLNTVTIPTYGGEVIQILSVAIDDLMVTGQVYGYSDVQRGENVYAGMETIYKWFLNYVQMATQGALGPVDYQNYEPGDTGVAYNQTSVKMDYPARGWTFQILPKGLPGFKYGIDVVAPEWMLQAAVVQPDQAFLDAFNTDHLFNQERLGNFASFNPPYTGWATGPIGFEADNPYSAPNKIGGQQITNTIDYFNKLIPNYLTADYETLSADFSKPATSKDIQAAGNVADNIVTQVQNTAKKKSG